MARSRRHSYQPESYYRSAQPAAVAAATAARISRTTRYNDFVRVVTRQFAIKLAWTTIEAINFRSAGGLTDYTLIEALLIMAFKDNRWAGRENHSWMSYEPIALGIYANSRPDAAYQRGADRLNERALYFVRRRARCAIMAVRGLITTR